ncbi:MAG: FprA family A-type flavoprotein [Bacteroidales bacterium]|nr:FprA family A-type flavoprotein [Bacteroidales bacterium]
MRISKISDRISYIGVNDRRTALFENNWPIPYGVSYNSYIIKDKKNVLIDTVEFGSDGEFLKKIETVLGGEKLDYLVVNHMEPDHSGMISSVIAKYPEVKVIGNAKTFELMEKYYGISQESFMAVTDNQEVEIGESTLKFVFIPWVHWPETMVTLDVKEGVLFTCDAFGGYGTLDGGIFDSDYNMEEIFLPEMRRYYSNIVAKYNQMVTRAITKLADTPVKMIAPSHGVVWKENPQKVISLYADWAASKSERGVVICYASMYGNTARLADTIGAKMAELGVKNVRTYDVSRSNASYILSDIMRYKGFILGTCAYNTFMHPMMEHLCNEIKIMAPKGKVMGIFGTSGWNGAGAKALAKFAEEAKLNLVSPTVEAFGAPTAEKVEENLNLFAESFVKALDE